MTALTLTPDASTGSVLLEVTGAPSPGPEVYHSTFAVGDTDGWTNYSGGTVGTDASGIAYDGEAAAFFDVLAGDSYAGAARNVGGLTVGTVYRYRVAVYQSSGPVPLRLSAPGGAQVSIPAVANAWRTAEVYFTATATTHPVYVLTDGAPDAYHSVYFAQAVVDPHPGGPVALTRTDANGTRAVRLPDGMEPIGGTMTVADYEAALAGLIRYDLTDGAGDTVSASTELAAELPRLGVAVLPQVAVELELVTGYEASRASSGTIHAVVGSGVPVPTIAELTTRRGTLQAGVADYATAADVEAVYTRGQVVLLRQPTHPGLDMYHVAESVQVTPDRAGRWSVVIRYVEVAPPNAPLQGALGWTYADVSGTYASYTELAAAFPSYADLAAGPVAP